MTPIVTVIVPGRDIAPYAPSALESLRAQSLHDWRAVLIDDGSTDATGEVFAAAAADDPRFEVVHLPEASGLSAARNAGLDKVDTPFLGFLDGDDELTPDALARLTGTLRDSGSDFVAGAYTRTRLVDGRYRPGRVQPWTAAATDPARRATTILAHPRASANIVAWSKVSRTSFWEGRRFPEGVAFEDQVLAQQMYVDARAFDVIPDVVVHWRLRAEGTSITQGKAQLPVLRDYLAALRGGVEVLREAGAVDAVVARIDLILAMDRPSLERIAAEHPDPAYRTELDAFDGWLGDLPEFARASPDPDLAQALSW